MTHPLLQNAVSRWQQLAPRERTTLTLVAAVLGMGLFVAVLIAPAWRTLRNSPAQLGQTQAQLHTMRTQAAEAQLLQQNANAATTLQSRAETLHLLEIATQRLLGTSATLAPGPDRVSVILQGTTPDALAQWLHDVRVTTRLLPTEAQLNQVRESTDNVRWNGSLVLAGPALEQP